MMRGFVATVATAAVLAPVCLGACLVGASSAGASEVVLGDDTGHACFEASRSQRADADAVHVCDVALDGSVMKPADRGGALVNRGVIRMRRGELTAAQSDFDAAIPLIPDSAEARFNRGAVFVGEHHYKEAIADLDKAIELGLRENAKVYYYRGIAHDYLDDEAAAYQDYRQAEALAPEWDLPKHELKRFTVTPK
jgi:tetratricopeptide (TPR) repeat protein